MFITGTQKPTETRELENYPLFFFGFRVSSFLDFKNLKKKPKKMETNLMLC